MLKAHFIYLQILTSIAVFISLIASINRQIYLASRPQSSTIIEAKKGLITCTAIIEIFLNKPKFSANSSSETGNVTLQVEQSTNYFKQVRKGHS